MLHPVLYRMLLIISIWLSQNLTQNQEEIKKKSIYSYKIRRKLLEFPTFYDARPKRENLAHKIYDENVYNPIPDQKK